MLPLRAHNPEAPHPLLVSSRAKTRDPYPRYQWGTPRGSNRAQSSSAFASINTFSHQMKLALSQGEAIRGSRVSLPAYISTASGYRSRLNGRDDTRGDYSAHHFHWETSPISYHNALAPMPPLRAAPFKPPRPLGVIPGEDPGSITTNVVSCI